MKKRRLKTNIDESDIDDVVYNIVDELHGSPQSEINFRIRNTPAKVRKKLEEFYKEANKKKKLPHYKGQALDSFLNVFKEYSMEFYSDTGFAKTAPENGYIDVQLSYGTLRVYVKNNIITNGCISYDKYREDEEIQRLSNQDELY